MKVALNWLKKYIDIKESPEELGELLTNTGLEVESIEEVETVPGGLKGVVIGEILNCTPHPNADKLKITMVNIGESEPVQIVCGAPNVAKGQKVVVATVNTTLYPKPDEPFQIKKSKIRGELSLGMICAEDELGLGNSHDGILVLDTGLPAGTPAAKYFNLESDTVFEIGLTPNRADATGHLGVARDIKAVTGNEINWPDVSAFATDNKDLSIKVIVENEQDCPRYSGVSMSGLTVKESPAWLKNALLSIGLEPINNIVDVTNFVLYETGQPLHAFDAAKIKGNTIKIKNLPESTIFKTLDDKERKLASTDLMICDGESNPMCIAGVFGGKDSGVSDTTTSIFLECAYFSADSIRKSSQKHQLKTDASFRYERGTDPNITVYALKRTALLIKEVAGGNISSEVIDHFATPVEDRAVSMKYKNIDRLIGKKLNKDSIHQILNRLDIKTENTTEEGFIAIVPPYRVDVTREADVIEEIIRIYGFNNVEIPETLSSSFLASFPEIDPGKIRKEAGLLLSANGFQEIMTNSLTKAAYSQQLGDFNEAENVEILNKLSEELGVMRQDLLFTGLEVLSHNINRKQNDLKFYEFGKIYKKINSKYNEKMRLALYLTGKNEPENWLRKNESIKYHDLYSAVLKIFNKFSAESIENEDFHSDIFDYGLKLKINQKTVCELGKLSKKALKLSGLKQDVFYANIDWEALLRKVNTNVQFEPVSKFPEVKRDLSLVIDKNVSYESIKKISLKEAGHLLSKIDVFDVYEGDKIDKDKKAYALSFTLQDKTKTLNDKIIDKTMNKLMQAFEQEIGAVIRK
ncbi:phenylalanine--tRNA ligase subunit beta [Marivirga sp. S37H4]|uniref:Phenylalanine--tRNA ligase beta subunit n=1 Tax=Marivirga aurantiaca TaxID=2802615 RepID=A0A935C7M7_9BACT|nr:phenylalanine--tRNA ligase subunit beta [Marivirga aurantiaca]MBK6264999.1 phenylalanine--tRNA ligase subunit beta [Marivirga aurantiaca]